MRYLQLIALSATLMGAAASTSRTYVVLYPTSTTTYTLDVMPTDNSASVAYRLRSAGVSDSQPYGTTTTLRLTSGALSSYKVGQSGKFRSLAYAIIIDGSVASVSSDTWDSTASPANKRSDIQIPLVPGTTGFVAWDAALLPEMLGSHPDSPKSCIFGLRAFELATRPLTYRPANISKSASGIAASCGAQSLEVWYDVRSLVTLWSRSINPNSTWKLAR
jgi:hypothetical protein